MWCLSASKLLMSEKGQCQSCPYWKNGGCSWTDKHDTPPCDCWMWDGSRPSAPRWINVKDALPELDETVLVCAKAKYNRDFRVCATTKLVEHEIFGMPTKLWKSIHDVMSGEYEITHWMPLPELPEEDEDENAD